MNLSHYTSADDIFSALFSLKNAPFVGANKLGIPILEDLLMTTFLLLQNEQFIKEMTAFTPVNKAEKGLCSYIAKSQNGHSRSRTQLTYFYLLINDIFIVLLINSRARSPPAS